MFHTSMFQVKRSEIDSFQSNQGETDTCIVIYIKYAEDQGFKSVVVCTPDTDVFFILLFHAHDLEIPIYVDIGTGTKQRLVNVSELVSTLGKNGVQHSLDSTSLLEKTVQVHLKEKARWHLWRKFWRHKDFKKCLGEVLCHVLFWFVLSALTAVGAYDVASLRR